VSKSNSFNIKPHHSYLLWKVRRFNFILNFLCGSGSASRGNQSCLLPPLTTKTPR